MAIFMLTHRHKPGECRSAVAAWQGFDSPLRRNGTLSSCISGGHSIWWQVEAADPKAALAQLPPFIAERTEVTEAREVRIP